MKNLALILSVACAMNALADTYDEQLDYIDTSGTQWIDTGIVPVYGSTRMIAELAMLETSDARWASRSA